MISTSLHTPSEFFAVSSFPMTSDDQRQIKVFVDFNDILCPHFDSRLPTFGGFYEGGERIVAVTVFGPNDVDELDKIVKANESLRKTTTIDDPSG